MSRYKKVAYATGSRADYGIVRRYLKLLNEDKDINFSLLVTGSHLDNRFGYSYNIIKNDGFNVDYKVDIKIDSSSNEGIINSLSICIASFGRYFQENKYDLLIILGDRYEMLAVAIAAAIHNIPILHLHGGEVTYGNYDEFIRHSITKMSRFHFTSTEVYRKRVIQLGENPERVFNVGALGAENCLMINNDNIENCIAKFMTKKYYVIAFHPETITNESIKQQVSIVIEALIHFKEEVNFIFMGTNADTHSNIISETWKYYTGLYDNMFYIENLNVDSYLYLIKHAECLIGNSSSGIIEAPSLGTYTINIGKRQEGRERGNSVIDVNCNKLEIINALKEVTERKDRKEKIENPYYQVETVNKYYRLTKKILELDINNPKRFYDI